MARVVTTITASPVTANAHDRPSQDSEHRCERRAAGIAQQPQCLDGSEDPGEHVVGHRPLQHRAAQHIEQGEGRSVDDRRRRRRRPSRPPSPRTGARSPRTAPSAEHDRSGQTGTVERRRRPTRPHRRSSPTLIHRREESDARGSPQARGCRLASGTMSTPSAAGRDRGTTPASITSRRAGPAGARTSAANPARGVDGERPRSGTAPSSRLRRRGSDAEGQQRSRGATRLPRRRETAPAPASARAAGGGSRRRCSRCPRPATRRSSLRRPGSGDSLEQRHQRVMVRPAGRVRDRSENDHQESVHDRRPRPRDQRGGRDPGRQACARYPTRTTRSRRDRSPSAAATGASTPAGRARGSRRSRPPAFLPARTRRQESRPTSRARQRRTTGTRAASGVIVRLRSTARSARSGRADVRQGAGSSRGER